MLPALPPHAERLPVSIGFRGPRHSAPPIRAPTDRRHSIAAPFRHSATPRAHFASHGKFARASLCSRNASSRIRRSNDQDGHRPRPQGHHAGKPVHRPRHARSAVRHPGAGTRPAGAGPARPRRRPEHRRPHLGLSRLAAGRARSRGLAPPGAAGRAEHPLPARRQRGPRRHHAVRHAAARRLPRQARRWRVRHVVRQGARRRSRRRRAALRQFHRHRAAWRRAGGVGRRPWRAFLDLSAPDRACVRGRVHPGAEPGLGAGHPRSRPRRHRAVALLRTLGRAEDHRRDRRAGGHARRPVHPELRHAGLRAAAAWAELRSAPALPRRARGTGTPRGAGAHPGRARLGARQPARPPHLRQRRCADRHRHRRARARRCDARAAHARPRRTTRRSRSTRWR